MRGISRQARGVAMAMPAYDQEQETAHDNPVVAEMSAMELLDDSDLSLAIAASLADQQGGGGGGGDVDLPNPLGVSLRASLLSGGRGLSLSLSLTVHPSRHPHSERRQRDPRSVRRLHSRRSRVPLQRRPSEHRVVLERDSTRAGRRPAEVVRAMLITH